MGRNSHLGSSSGAAAAESSAAAGRRSNPPRRARNAQSATAAQASALHSSSSTRSSRASAVAASPPTTASSERGRRPSAAAGTRRSPSDSPAVGVGSSASLRMVAASFSASAQGQGSHATGSPASSVSFGHSSSGATIIPPAVSTPTESLQFEQDPITATSPRDDGMDPAQLSALVAALGPVPGGWSLSAGEPYHRFDKSAFAGAELPTILDPDSRAKCLAFLQDPRVLRVTELEPSVEGLPRLSACVCPICGTLVKDNWVPSRSGGFRRQIRTESLKEHLGMRHHLLRRVKCPVQDLSGCNCRGYCKAHRLLNHFSDNIGCLVHIDQLLATHAASSTNVLSTIQWALGSDWPRAYDELSNAANLASGGPAVVELDVQFAKCRELVLSRVAKARKVAVGVIEQAIQVHRHEQAPASVVGLWQSSVDDGQSGAPASVSTSAQDVRTDAASPASQSRLEAPSRTSTLDSLLAVPTPSPAQSRSPLLIVTHAPSAAANDMLFDQFQLQPMSPTASDGASNWSQGTSVSASTSHPHDASMLPPMDSYVQQDALFGSLGMYSAAQSQFDFAFPQQHNDMSLSAPIGLDLPATAPILPPGFVLPSALDTRTAPPHFMSPPHSNPHTPVHSPIHPPAPVMLAVPDWVQAHIPASVSPAGSPAASPYLFPAHSPHLMATLASHAPTTGLTPLMDQHLRFPGTSSPAASPSMHASAPFLGVYSPQLLASPAFLATSAAPQTAAMSPMATVPTRQSPPDGQQHHRARVMHFVPTPDNMLVDGVYIGPVGPSVVSAAVSGGGASSGWPASAGMGFTTVADALDLRQGGGGGYYFRS